MTIHIISYICIYVVHITVIIFMQTFINEDITLTKRCALVSLVAEAIIGVFFIVSVVYSQVELSFFLCIGLLFGLFPLIVIKLNNIPKEKIKKTYCDYCLCLLLTSFIESSITWSLENFLKCFRVYSSVLSNLLLTIITCVLAVYIYMSFTKYRIFVKFSTFDVILFIIYTLLLFNVYNTSENMDMDIIFSSNGYSTTYILQNLVTLAFSVFMPILICNNLKSNYYNELRIRNERFLEAELVAANIYREAQEDTRAFRHDINNNLSIISELMSKKKYSEAEEYINQLCGKISALSPRIVTGDDMLDSIITSKLSEIERDNIKLTISGVIDGGLDWKAIDICAVFANLLDNAVEACNKIPDADKRYINIQFKQTDLQRIINISNSIENKVNCEELDEVEKYTSKEDKNNHGYGLKNIRAALDKYGAVMQISSDSIEYMTSIMIMKQPAR